MYWLEGRPTEGGRMVLVRRWAPEQPLRQLTSDSGVLAFRVGGPVAVLQHAGCQHCWQLWPREWPVVQLSARRTAGASSACRNFSGKVEDVTPAHASGPWNVRTTVHEYGGGSYALSSTHAYFANFKCATA